MGLVGKSLLTLAPLALAGCSSLSGGGETCLTLTDDHESPDKIRAGTAPETIGGQPLCEGLAYLRENKAGAARTRLELALKQASPEHRWAIEGYLAQAQALEQVGVLALRN